MDLFRVSLLKKYHVEFAFNKMIGTVPPPRAQRLFRTRSRQLAQLIAVRRGC